MSALQQFVGGTIIAVHASDGEAVAFTVRLADGTTRDVAIYHAFQEDVAVRIDGQYVPPEEL